MWDFFCIFAADFKKKFIMQIAINPALYGSAQTYADKQGLNLTAMIEDFLWQFVAPATNVAAEQKADKTKPIGVGIDEHECKGLIIIELCKKIIVLNFILARKKTIFDNRKAQIGSIFLQNYLQIWKKSSNFVAFFEKATN